MKTITAGPAASLASVDGSGKLTASQRYMTLGGSWAAWLFDALDATVFGFVLLAIAKTFSVGLGDVVSTVAWFLLATGIGGFCLGNISDKIGRKKTMMISVFVYGTGTLLCGFADSLWELTCFASASVLQWAVCGPQPLRWSLKSGHQPAALRPSP